MNDQSPAKRRSDADPSTTGAPPPPAPRRRRRVPPFLIPLLTVLLLMIVVAVWGGRWYLHQLDFVEETNARIDADLTAIASRVSGWVTAMPVGEGDAVASGAVLAQVDDRQALLRRNELEAEHRAVLAQRDRVAARIAMVDGQTESRLASERARLTAAKALGESLELELRYARDEFARAEALAKRGVIPARQLDETRTAYLRAEQARLRARAQVASADADLAEARSARGEIAVLNAELVRLEHEADKLANQASRQALEIEDHAIKSPLDGVVSRTFASVGQYVTAGQRIALLHDPSDVWVEALIKETVIRRVHPGQPVEVHVDAYPDRVFDGRVTKVGHAATSQFTLLPTPNPSGNFTKITQRLPVRIAVAQDHGLLKPGMMVEISVDTRER